jgi:hypothetical protein
MEILSRETQDGCLPHHIGLDLHLLVYALFASPIYCLSACFLARLLQAIKFLPIKGTVLDLIKAWGMVATASTHLCGVTA